MRITYVKQDHGLSKPNKTNETEVKKWNVVINQLSRPSTLCSISAFIIAVILLIFLIMDTMQYWTEQPKENKPELQKKTTQTETTTVLCSHSVGLCLSAFAYCYAVVERNSPRSKEWLILYTTLVIHLLLFSWRVAIEVLMLKYQSLTSNTIIS